MKLNWFIFFVISTSALAEDIVVVIGDAAYKNYPDTTDRMMAALESTGHSFTLNVFPGNQARNQVINGIAAMDLFGHQHAYAGIPEVGFIPTPVEHVAFSMFTSKSTPHNCDLSPSEIGELTLVGLQGMDMFEKVLKPRFHILHWAPSFENAVKMVSSGRGDVSFWLTPALNSMNPELIPGIHVCENNGLSLDIHSHIHSDYAWLQESIGEAYQEEFY